MKCPVCDEIKMREVEKEGVMIDICPNCKGVWLDRGELEKLMSGVREIRDEFNDWYYKEHKPVPPSTPTYPNTSSKPAYHDPYAPQNHSPYPPQGYYGKAHYDKKHKKKSVIDVFGDLFG